MALCTENSESNESTARDACRKVAAVIVTRLARLFLRAGLSFGDFQELARTSFCSAAEEHLATIGARPTTSRIAVMTGLSRADVSRTRKLDHVPESKAHYRPRSDRVLHGWRSDPDFTDSSGLPTPLRRSGPNSFEALCRRYSGDIPSRALLEELIARNMIRSIDDDHFELRPNDNSHGRPSIDVEEITAAADLFFGACLETDRPTLPSRIATTFPGHKIPSHVLKTCRQRAAKFLAALSTYMHGEALVANDQDSDSQSALSFVFFESVTTKARDTTTYPARKDRKKH